MVLKNLFGREDAPSACGSACGSNDKKSSACGSACGSGDKKN